MEQAAKKAGFNEVALLEEPVAAAIYYSQKGTMGHQLNEGDILLVYKLESIFERFQQVDSSDSRRKGGTGLGLTICRNIIEQHEGKIWAESTLGKGSTFSFTLPLLNV